MQNKIKLAVFLMSIPVILNVIGCFLSFFGFGQLQFIGYLTGTLLSMFFSIIWILILKKVADTNAMALFAYSLGSFPVKLILFAIFALTGHYVLKMSLLFFGIAFLFGVVSSLIIEVWFMFSLSQYLRSLKNEKGDVPKT